MDVENFIQQKLEMIKSGFGLQQIRNETWRYICDNAVGVLEVSAMIDRAMELYAEIIKRSLVEE